MTGFQQPSQPGAQPDKPQGIRHFRSAAAARSNGLLQMGSKPFCILSHPRWVEFAWVAPPEYAMPKALWGGIQIVEVVGR